jgi:hypothetical protein
MSERIDLRSGEEIRDWARENEFDIVDLESEDTPRFFQRKFTPQPGPIVLFGVEHAYYTDNGRPMVSVKRVFRASSAEEALQQYLLEPKERSCGRAEQQVSFKLYVRPGGGQREAISVTKLDDDQFF